MPHRTGPAAYFLFLVVTGIAFIPIIWQFRASIVIEGAVLEYSSDIGKQTPIADVHIEVPRDFAPADSQSDFAGFFEIRLDPWIRRGQPVQLRFLHPDFQPLDLTWRAGDQLLVVRMKPLNSDAAVPVDRPEVVISNVTVRYAVETTNVQNIGSGVKIFQIANTGNVPCDHAAICSPDGKWKASEASASLDAGAGNEFRNARVSCIAGPCPFTKIDTDGFSSGGRMINVSIRDWSDSTTFVLQAELFRVQMYDIVRRYYPTIIGRTLNFTLPSGVSGLSLQAQVNGVDINFPLGPRPVLSWADCKVSAAASGSTVYRCELKPWCRFR